MSEIDLSPSTSAAPATQATAHLLERPRALSVLGVLARSRFTQTLWGIPTAIATCAYCAVSTDGDDRGAVFPLFFGFALMLVWTLFVERPAAWFLPRKRAQWIQRLQDAVAQSGRVVLVHDDDLRSDRGFAAVEERLLDALRTER